VTGIPAAVAAVPDAVRAKAAAAGAAGRLADLPAIVAGLEQDREITVGAPYGDATEALVARATLADGSPAVLLVCTQVGLQPGGRQMLEVADRVAP
jgi:hypothetical protein